jgi:hypothetical protein
MANLPPHITEDDVAQITRIVGPTYAAEVLRGMANSIEREPMDAIDFVTALKIGHILRWKADRLGEK